MRSVAGEERCDEVARVVGVRLKDCVLDVDDFLAAAERVAGRGSALDPKVVAA